MSRDVDWSKAGKRLRWQPPGPRDGGRNPDWNWVAKRWKDEADYYAEELTAAQVVDLGDCSVCGATAGRDCPIEGLASHHQPRRRAAGIEMLRLHGPRFGGDPAP